MAKLSLLRVGSLADMAAPTHNRPFRSPFAIAGDGRSFMLASRGHQARH